MVYITTYANKSQGMFEELVNNEFGVRVEILGWGTKWNGYKDKLKGLLVYLDTRDDEDIVVLVDGFDTKINKPTKDLESRFKKMDCKVLLSKEPQVNQDIMGNIVFGNCKNGVTANAGMYMGYTRELKEVISDTLRLKCNDDQVNLNTICNNYDFIKVDENEIIFKNVSPIDNHNNTDAIFVSYPGSVSFKRYVRGIFEYTQFRYIHILSLIIIGLMLFPSKTHILLPILLGYSSFYAFLADKSCTLD